MVDLRSCATFLFLLLLIGCGQSEPAKPTAVSLATPTATILPTITAVPATATFTPTPLPTTTSTPAPTATSTPPPTPVRAGPTVTPIPVGNEVGFELVAQVGGQINSFAVSGDYILAGQGPRLVVLDASNLANLTPIGQSDPLPGLVSNVMVRGETAVSTAGHLLMVWDISDPTQPVPVHSLALPAAGTLLWQDNIIYAAGLIASQYVEQEGSSSQHYESYVATIDVGGPPRLLDQITLPYNIITAALVADILYVSIANQPAQNVLGVDVTNPAQLSDPIPIPLAIPTAFSLRAYGDTLLVGGSYQLAAYDVSNTRRPNYLWHEEGGEMGQVYDFAVQGQQVHTLGWQAAGAFIPSQRVIDLPQPLPEPTVLGRQVRAQLGNRLGISIMGVEDHLFRLLPASLDIFHLDGEAQTFVGSYTPPVGGHPAIWDETIYVGLEAGHVDSYRLADLTPLDRYTLPDNDRAEFTQAIYSLTATNGRLYLTGNRQFHILDAASLTPLGQFLSPETDSLSFLWQQGWRFYAPPIVDNVAFAYAMSRSANSDLVVMLDISDPDDIQELDSIRPLPNQQYIHVAQAAATEKWLALSLRGPEDDYLSCYSLETAEPDLLAEIPLNIAPTAMQVRSDLLAAGGGGTFRDDGFLQIYRLPDETPLATLRLPGVHDLYLLDDLLLVTTETGRRLLAYDLSDPGQPQAVGSFDLPFHRGRLAVSGDYVVVADQLMGLYLLRLER